MVLERNPVFSKPGFQSFQTLLLGIPPGRSKKNVTAAVKIAKVQQHFSQGNRFVGAYVWNPRASGVAVISLVITTINLNPKTATIANDSTLLNRFGAKIVGCGFRFDSD